MLALQEWRHWLEGSAEPFVVWTDHKKLAYLRGAKRPHSLASLSGMLLTHSPGSKNTKSDMLSHQFTTDQLAHDPGPIPSPSWIMGAVLLPGR